MAITRQFLDVTRPALPAVVDYLVEQYRQGDAVDLGKVVIVVPGRRAGRRLLEILVDRAEEQSLLLTPPEVTTEGALPERLYRLQQPLAGKLVQQLAWTRALRELSPELLAHITATAPGEDDDSRWMELGEVLRQQHTELAADGLNFADVLEQGQALPDFQEADRWQALHTAQQGYLRILDELQLWDVQTARLVAIERREIQTDGQIVLLGTVDLNGAMRKILDLVADRVTALIHAPADWADRFDEHGCAIPEAWLEATIDLHDQQIRRVDGPSEQAEAVTRWLASLDGHYRADQITIGLADEAIAPQIQRQLQQCNVPSRWVIGKMLSETAPCRLLAAVADYLQRGRFHDFAALVRHADVDNLLRKQVGDDFLTPLDKFYNRRLSARLDRDWKGGPSAPKAIERLHHAVKELLKNFPKQPMPLGDWAELITGLLTDIYGHHQLDRDDPTDKETLSVCKKIHNVLQQHRTIPAALAPSMTAAEAIRLTLAQLQGEAIPSPTDDEAIELLGWLELALDDAPALIVTSFNDGLVPKSVNADAFLPNQLRRHLGLLDNDRRFARDAYALSVLAATRKDFSLIVGRRDGEGNPLAPSRLLFADEVETVARRSLNFFQPPNSTISARSLLATGVQPLHQSTLQPPRPQPLAEPIEAIAVTSFKTYLACPYRFYLSRVLKLAALLDSAAELDAAAFGTLLHDVLNQFGENSAAREITVEEDIYALLSDLLDQRVEGILGTRRRAAVEVQIEQLRWRLKAFAAWQAQWTLDGWRIEWTETSHEENKPTLDVDGHPMILRGRIDRIDLHRDTGRRVIFDYKSGDTARSPKQTHQKKGEWVDLQLPLYRHLIRGLGIDDPVDLGYIVLPKDASKVGHLLAGWGEEELAAAEEVAREVVRNIREQVFEPIATPPPAFMEEFAPICHDRMFGRVLSSDDGEGVA